MTYKRKEVIGPHTLYLGDCLEVMPTLGMFDAVVTDPPYGVNFNGKSWTSQNRGKTVKRKEKYASSDDDMQYFANTVSRAIEIANGISRCAVVFMASSNICNLPDPIDIGGIYLPAGTGRTGWGFNNFMHCAYYGKDPYLANGLGAMPNGKYGIYGNDSNMVAHPCAKPIAAMLWSVKRGSLLGWSVLDPFMGSGTTGVACQKLGRVFTGIELDPGYFDIACKRIEEAVQQPDLFIETPAKPEQTTFDLEAAE